jgi:hypothetical protein
MVRLSEPVQPGGDWDPRQRSLVGERKERGLSAIFVVHAGESGRTPAPEGALERYFKPLEFSCKGGSGTFTPRRWNAANHVVEVDLDLGTWSHTVTAHFHVQVPGHRCTLPMPAAPRLDGARYPIGDADRWEKIVANLAALSAHLDHQIVPDFCMRLARPRNASTRRIELS